MIQDFKGMPVAYNSIQSFISLYVQIRGKCIYFYTLFHEVSVSVDHLAFVHYHEYSSMKIKTQRPLKTEEYKMKELQHTWVTNKTKFSKEG